QFNMTIDCIPVFCNDVSGTESIIELSECRSADGCKDSQCQELDHSSIFLLRLTYNAWTANITTVIEVKKRLVPRLQNNQNYPETDLGTSDDSFRGDRTLFQKSK